VTFIGSYYLYCCWRLRYTTGIPN